jgi:rifampicin phosphotransferase
METIITLEKCLSRDTEIVGGKAANIARLIDCGFKVPQGLCVTAAVYKQFIEKTGARGFLEYELGRKPLEAMRWEEMWDASLRIRNFFLKADLPADLRENILVAVANCLKGKALAIRSSSNFEDSEINSYAGLHESFLNVEGEEETIKHVKLVWASLWSDAAIAYSRELGLDPYKCAMSVVIQEMMPGEVSGVAFGISPVDEKMAVIEAVAGLNKGLVDGDVEPDRWIIERATGHLESYFRANETRKTVSVPGGTKIAEDAGAIELLTQAKVMDIYNTLVAVEKKMSFVPDLEWTIMGDEIYLLQVRPVSRAKFQDTDKRRGWDMTLRRSFNNLKDLSSRITGELIPAMIADAGEMEKNRLNALDDAGLAEEIKKRKDVYEKWQDIYWDEFIPFAHGARLFGQVYNDRVSPEDPHEFVDLISSEGIVSVSRNIRLEDLAAKLRTKPEAVAGDLEITDGDLRKEIQAFLVEFPGIAGEGLPAREKEKNMIKLLRRIASRPVVAKNPAKNKEALENMFLDSFGEDEKQEARELLALGRLSYRLRDDDNVYLGRIEAELLRAMALARTRLGERCRDERSCEAAEEVIAALKMPEYVPRIPARKKDRQDGNREKRRQMRGQPAGKGIARGKARVINERADLFDTQAGEILVCDSIDPEMTFIIPVVAGIIERRGGMLIHGAIIAREYGIPCVTGVEGATAHIKNGDDLTVDGYFGLVINHSVGQ